MADLTDNIVFVITPAPNAVRGTDGDNLGACVAQELRRLDKSRAVGDCDKLLLTNGHQSIYEHQ
jgi:hypothetical protein